MKKRSLLAVPVMFASLLAHGQAAPSPGQQIPGPGPEPSADAQEQKDVKIGSYHLVTTFWTPGPTTHLMTPQPSVELKTASPRNPGEAAGTIPLPNQSAFDSLGNPSYDCAETTPVGHGCQNIDIARITPTDPKNLNYRFTNHGNGVRLTLNIQLRDYAIRSQQDAEQDWHPGQVIFVSVPKPTPTFNIVSVTVVGTWNKDAIVFEAGKPLPAAAKKGLDDLNVKQDLGDRILYSYRVKEASKESKSTKGTKGK